MAATPFVADNYVVRLCTFLCMYAALALSWNVIGGYAGYPSFSTAGFFGLGAYAGALLQNSRRCPQSCPGSAATAIVALFAASTRARDSADEGPLLRDRLARHRRGPAPGRVVVGVAHRWGRRPERPAFCQGGPDYAGRVFLFAMMAMMIVSFVVDAARRPHAAGLRPALHQAERGCRRHGRHRRHLLQDRGFHAVGDVLRDYRRDLRLVGCLYRPVGRVQHSAERQGPGHDAARRAGDGAAGRSSAPGSSWCSRR